MKTLKILFVLCIMLGFAMNTTNGQPQQSEGSGPYGYYYPCNNEYITGTLNFHKTVIGDKTQIVAEGILIGSSDDHPEYYVRGMTIVLGKWGKIDNIVSILTLTVRKDGNIVGLLHMFNRYTVNPKGELVISMYKYDWTCI